MPASTLTFDPEHPIIKEELRKAEGSPIKAFFAIRKHAADVVAGLDAIKFADRVLDHYGRSYRRLHSVVMGFTPTTTPPAPTPAPIPEAPPPAPLPEATGEAQKIQRGAKVATPAAKGNFTMVPNAILQDDTIPFAIKGLYATVLLHGKPAKKDGSRPAQPGYPSYTTLAREGQCSRSTVIRGIKFLEKRGLLKITRRTGTTNLYLGGKPVSPMTRG